VRWISVRSLAETLPTHRPARVAEFRAFNLIACLLGVL
jgi:hypothetical protein